jgi:hypothetical protein
MHKDGGPHPWYISVSRRHKTKGSRIGCVVGFDSDVPELGSPAARLRSLVPSCGPKKECHSCQRDRSLARANFRASPGSMVSPHRMGRPGLIPKFAPAFGLRKLRAPLMPAYLYQETEPTGDGEEISAGTADATYRPQIASKWQVVGSVRGGVLAARIQDSEISLPERMCAVAVDVHSTIERTMPGGCTCAAANLGKSMLS